MTYEPRHLSADEIAIFRECFNEYDQDQGGNITSEEFGRVMRKTSPNVSDDEVAKIISEVDLDGDGTINFDEFITMMTGQPYKSPAAAQQQPSAPAAAAGETKSDDEGTPSTTPQLEDAAAAAAAAAAPPGTSGGSAGALRGVSTMSAKLKRQRQANQVYKDAWLATEPTLQGSITPSELLWKVAPAVPGLVVNEEDVAALVDPEDAERRITYERFLEFAKRQENDDIFSDYGA